MTYFKQHHKSLLCFKLGTPGATTTCADRVRVGVLSTSPLLLLQATNI